MKNKKAFTLIELLVVIAIIGLLATISVIALQNARAKSRDAKRVGDIKQVSTALELFFNDKNRYPTVEEWNTGKIYSTSTDSTSTYMQIVPNAPTPNDGGCTTNQNSITYTPTADGSSYSISFCLGNTTGTLAPGPKCLTPGGILNLNCSGGESEEIAGDVFSCPEAPLVQYEGGPYNSDGISTTTGGYYRTVKIGSQCWLRDNLNVGTQINTPTDQTNNGVVEKYCFSNNIANCSALGGLYKWGEGVQYLNGASNSSDWSPAPTGNVQGLCPSGWHLPTHNELTDLERAVCTSGNCTTDFPYDLTTVGERGTNEGDKLKLNTSFGNGNNAFGFSAVSAGIYDPWMGFFAPGEIRLMSATLGASGNSAWIRQLKPELSNIHRSTSYKVMAIAIRCLKD